jgi:hypothetical protein
MHPGGTNPDLATAAEGAKIVPVERKPLSTGTIDHFFVAK